MKKFIIISTMLLTIALAGCGTTTQTTTTDKTQASTGSAVSCGLTPSASC